MSEEIKEILDFKENADYKKLSVDEIVILKNCITNLQEENKRLKAEVKLLDDNRIHLNNLLEEKDKKIERINKALDYLETFVEVDVLIKGKMVQPAINILKGVDKE